MRAVPKDEKHHNAQQKVVIEEEQEIAETKFLLTLAYPEPN